MPQLETSFPFTFYLLPFTVFFNFPPAFLTHFTFLQFFYFSSVFLKLLSALLYQHCYFTFSNSCFTPIQDFFNFPDQSFLPSVDLLQFSVYFHFCYLNVGGYCYETISEENIRNIKAIKKKKRMKMILMVCSFKYFV